jgi:ribosome-binding ATPase
MKSNVQVGIIGLPKAGKTTIFNALTGSDAETGAFHHGRGPMRTAVIDVPDRRVDALSAMFHPQKTTYAQIQFNDISGVSRGQTERDGFDSQMLNALSQCDALLQVVRGFESPLAPDDDVDPVAELADLRLELLLADLTVIERRLERIAVSLLRARAGEKPALEAERALLERCREALEAERHIADVEMTDEERLMLRGFGFLTAKPTVVVVNLGEDDDPQPALDWANHHRLTTALALRGAIEMEIAQLPAEEATLFLADYGIAEPTLHAMVRECYRLLGLVSFFTVGEDEVRAWTVRGEGSNGSATALAAAAAIHSDLARGFIRAEVLSYDDMLACGTLAEARKRGKLRLEGKEYAVQDGDILSIRFNV